MIAITRQIRNRLKTTARGLGLVRLLQDAKRYEEARTVLALLEHGAAEMPSQKSCTVNQLAGDTKSSSLVAQLVH